VPSPQQEAHHGFDQATNAYSEFARR